MAAPTPLTCSITSLWAPKRGNLKSEYEDAFAQNPAGESVHDSSCFLAVSDGATESSFAGIWAKQLTRSFCSKPFFTEEEAIDRIDGLSAKWHEIVFRKPLPWFAEEKAKMGAFATFLGLGIFANTEGGNHSGDWHAALVGDSCLFYIHNDELLLSVPINDSDDFGNAPILISSIPSRNKDVWNHLVLLSGEWESGDLIILATDALAAWFLIEVENGHKPWNELLLFSKEPDVKVMFPQWADHKQQGKAMRNDDVTCILIELN